MLNRKGFDDVVGPDAVACAITIDSLRQPGAMHRPCAQSSRRVRRHAAPSRSCFDPRLRRARYRRCLSRQRRSAPRTVRLQATHDESRVPATQGPGACLPTARHGCRRCNAQDGGIQIRNGGFDAHLTPVSFRSAPIAAMKRGQTPFVLHRWPIGGLDEPRICRCFRAARITNQTNAW